MFKMSSKLYWTPEEKLKFFKGWQKEKNLDPNNVRFTKSSNITKIIGHYKKQENVTHNQDKNFSIETD